MKESRSIRYVCGKPVMLISINETVQDFGIVSETQERPETGPAVISAGSGAMGPLNKMTYPLHLYVYYNILI